MNLEGRNRGKEKKKKKKKEKRRKKGREEGNMSKKEGKYPYLVFLFNTDPFDHQKSMQKTGKHFILNSRGGGVRFSGCP